MKKRKDQPWDRIEELRAVVEEMAYLMSAIVSKEGDYGYQYEKTLDLIGKLIELRHDRADRVSTQKGIPK